MPLDSYAFNWLRFSSPRDTNDVGTTVCVINCSIRFAGLFRCAFDLSLSVSSSCIRKGGSPFIYGVRGLAVQGMRFIVFDL
jgi:hypothetical protein